MSPTQYILSELSRESCNYQLYDLDSRDSMEMKSNDQYEQNSK